MSYVILIKFFSFQALCIWDVTEQCLLQMVTVKFPFSHRQPDFGTSILCCLPSPGTTATLAIACNQNIAKFKLGSSTQSNRRWGVVSHQTPVTAVLYDSGFNQVCRKPLFSPSLFLSVYLSTHTSIYLSIHPFICLLICLFIYLSVCLSVSISINVFFFSAGGNWINQSVLSPWHLLSWSTLLG